jgi:hypothetical protein
MSSDLIAYLEARRQRRNRVALYVVLGLASLALAVLAVTAILHATGVGSHIQTTIHVTARSFHTTLTRVGGVPILP